MLLRAFFDPLVDRPEDFLVVGRCIGEIHLHIVPRIVTNAKPETAAADGERPLFQLHSKRRRVPVTHDAGNLKVASLDKPLSRSLQPGV
jgi:hypothetical protein